MLRKRSFLAVFVLAILYGCSSDDNRSEPMEEPEGMENTDVIVEDAVSLNPNSYAPLSAIITLETNTEVRVSLKVEGKKGVASDILKDFPALDTNFEIPVHGLYSDTANEVTLSFTNSSGASLGSKTYIVNTAPLLADLPRIDISMAERSEMASGLTLVSYFRHNGDPFPQKPFMFDSFGDIRWYLDFDGHPELDALFYDDGIERLANGNFYFGSGGSTFGGQANNKIYEVDLFGNIVDSWDMPGYQFHHEVHEKPNGNFVVTVNKINAPTIEDFIIEIDRQSKEIVNVWDLNESLDNTRTTWTIDNVDWFHANAVVYDPSDDTIIVSGRTQGLVKLTADNEVVWILAPHKEWGTAGNGTDLTQFLLTPLDSQGQVISDQAVLDGDSNHPDFEWSWYQHAPLIMPNGDIMQFDNGDSRNYTGLEFYSRAVSYRIDELNKTIQQIWQFGKERGLEDYSRIVSDVDYLPDTDHVLYSPGAISFQGRLHGKSIEVDFNTNEVVFEATVVPPMAFFNIISLHRTERLPLYPD